MRERFRQWWLVLKAWWPVLKWLLGIAIVFAVGRQFWRDLSEHPEVLQRPLHVGWLVLSGMLYLLGIGFSALYWQRLLVHLGRRPSLWAAARAYYVSQPGKYLPGKAMALVMRAGSIHSSGVGPALATVTAFHEVLTTMAAGSLLSAVLFAVLPAPDTGASLSWETIRGILRLELPPGSIVDRKTCVLLSLGLFAVCVTPLLPPVFNRLVQRITRPFRDKDSAAIPPIRFGYLIEGLSLTMVGWLFLGASLAAAIQGTIGPDLAWNSAALRRVAAPLAMAYVAGFVIPVPGGLGVREFLLRLFLVTEVAALCPQSADALSDTIVVVVVLRCVWTLAEVMLAAAIYWLPGRRGMNKEELRIANCELQNAK
jgi:hypothetical protein